MHGVDIVDVFPGIAHEEDEEGDEGDAQRHLAHYRLRLAALQHEGAGEVVDQHHSDPQQEGQRHLPVLLVVAVRQHQVAYVASPLLIMCAKSSARRPNAK
jgi:hypothetical protein